MLKLSVTDSVMTENIDGFKTGNMETCVGCCEVVAVLATLQDTMVTF